MSVTDGVETTIAIVAPVIPPAMWGEAADGERGLIATSCAAYADLTPTPKRDGSHSAFVFEKEGMDSFGGYVTPDGARCIVSVLMRWLSEIGICWMCQGTGLYVPASNPSDAPIACPQCRGVAK